MTKINTKKKKEGWKMMKKNKTPEAQIKATAKYKKNNPERNRYNSYKSSTKLFILKHANDEDLDQVEEWIQERQRG